MISGSGDSIAILWDTGMLPAPERPRPKLLHRLEGHKAHIYAVGFSPDGSRAVTGSYDHDLRLWRVADGKEIAHMTGHGDKVRSLAVAPDGTIASGDWSGEIRLWNARDGRFLRVLAKQGTAVGSLSFSPDGKLLLSGISRSWPIATHQGQGLQHRQRQGDRHLYRPRQYRARHGLQPGRALGGDRRRQQPGDPPLGPAFGQAPARTRWQAVAARRPGQTVWAAGFSADGRRIGWGNAWQQDDPMRGYGPLQQALTLPLGEGALGAPVALGEAEAGAFRRAQASFGGFSLSHRKGGDYGYDAILDISKDGRAVASIARDTHEWLQPPVL